MLIDPIRRGRNKLRPKKGDLSNTLRKPVVKPGLNTGLMTPNPAFFSILMNIY